MKYICLDCGNEIEINETATFVNIVCNGKCKNGWYHEHMRVD